MIIYFNNTIGRDNGNDERVRNMNRFVAMEEGIGASKFELIFLKSLHFLTFRKSNRLAYLIEKVNKDLGKIKNRKVF